MALRVGINHFKNFSVYPTKTGLSDFATPVGGEYAVTSIRKQYEHAQYIKHRLVDREEIGKKRRRVKQDTDTDRTLRQPGVLKTHSQRIQSAKFSLLNNSVNKERR